eukprot:gene18308-823_t
MLPHGLKKFALRTIKLKRNQLKPVQILYQVRHKDALLAKSVTRAEHTSQYLPDEV